MEEVAVVEEALVIEAEAGAVGTLFMLVSNTVLEDAMELEEEVPESAALNGLELGAALSVLEDITEDDGMMLLEFDDPVAEELPKSAAVRGVAVGIALSVLEAIIDEEDIIAIELEESISGEPSKLAALADDAGIIVELVPDGAATIVLLLGALGSGSDGMGLPSDEVMLGSTS